MLLIPAMCALVVISVFIVGPAALCSSDPEGWCDFTVVLIGGPIVAGLAGVISGNLLLGRSGVVIGSVSLVAGVVAVFVLDSIRGVTEPDGWGTFLAITAVGVVMYGTGMVLAFGLAYRLGTAIARRREVHA